MTKYSLTPEHRARLPEWVAWWTANALRTDLVASSVASLVAAHVASLVAAHVTALVAASVASLVARLVAAAMPSPPLPDAPDSRFLRVRCGTGREFVLPVPAECANALGANAWTYGVDESVIRELEVRT